MKSAKHTESKPRFEKVGECLYRYSSNGAYYALLEQRGKQKRQSLETIDKAVAKRKLADLKNTLGRTDPSAGRTTLKELCTRYLSTMQNQQPRTKQRKEDIIRRLLADFPAGPQIQISKIRKSALEAWLASYEFGPPSHNLYLLALKAMFDLAVHDKLIADSPAHLHAWKFCVRSTKWTPGRATRHCAGSLPWGGSGRIVSGGRNWWLWLGAEESASARIFAFDTAAASRKPLTNPARGPDRTMWTDRCRLLCIQIVSGPSQSPAGREDRGMGLRRAGELGKGPGDQISATPHHAPAISG